MNIVATGVPATLEDYQVALNAAFEGGKAMGKATAEAEAWKEFVGIACARIKSADDAAADRDYMLDSDDCIAVLRGTWKGNYLNDQPQQPKSEIFCECANCANGMGLCHTVEALQQEQGEPVIYGGHTASEMANAILTSSQSKQEPDLGGVGVFHSVQEQDEPARSALVAANRERDGWMSHAEDLAKSLRFAQADLDLMRSHQEKNVWYWQGDGYDHLESMGSNMVVVIHANDLRAMLAERGNLNGANWSVFNTGACVADGLTMQEAKEYMTPERIARGWTAVYCVVVESDDEWPTAKQEQGEPVAWHQSKDGLPPVGSEVIGGHFYKDTWLKGEPEVFGWGRCTVIDDNHPDFPEGKRWITFGPSHNQISHWCWPPQKPSNTTSQQRKPLTDEQLKPHHQNQEWLDGVRFAEQFHNIKE